MSSGSECAACSRAQWCPKAAHLDTRTARRERLRAGTKGITVLLILNLLRGAMAAQLRGVNPSTSRASPQEALAKPDSREMMQTRFGGDGVRP